jgi:hypothetical protein
MKKLTTYDIGYIMKKFKLKSIEDFDEFGLRLKYFSSGCSRKVYTIRGYPDLVVKIPEECPEPSAVRHAKNEIKAYQVIKRSTKKYKELQPHVPEIYAWNSDGVILMKKYKFVNRGNAKSEALQKVAERLFPYNGDTDTYVENLGRDEKGNLICIDMGCFFNW